MNKRKLIESLPYPMQKFAAQIGGSVIAKERYGLIDREWHAYGMIAAALSCKARGIKGFSSIEFGVASGRGLLNMKKVAKLIKQDIGIDVKCYGFDTGKGLTEIVDYRDHPEKWKAGDYVMPNPEDLKRRLGNDVELILGEIKDTLPSFFETIDPDYPIGFISSDVDLYSSTKDSLKILNGDINKFLPYVHIYFDDCHGSVTTNQFCGELLAIQEFNQENDYIKIDKDRAVRARHPGMPYQIYFDRMYIAHFFKHPNLASKHTKSKFV